MSGPTPEELEGEWKEYFREHPDIFERIVVAFAVLGTDAETMEKIARSSIPKAYCTLQEMAEAVEMILAESRKQIGMLADALDALSEHYREPEITDYYISVTRIFHPRQRPERTREGYPARWVKPPEMDRQTPWRGINGGGCFDRLYRYTTRPADRTAGRQGNVV